MKFNIGNQVTNKHTHPGQVGTIIEIDPSKKCAYRVDFAGRPAIWHPENELELYVEKQFQSINGRKTINTTQTMNIRINIGLDGELVEKHHFENCQTAMDFLKSRIPSLTDEQLIEVCTSEDTQIQVSDMIESYDGSCAYWGVIRYEIFVQSF
jgi:hypothetical protein